MANGMKIIALILAGGRGSRMMSCKVPKQFVEIGGKPVVVHTLEVFDRVPRVDAMIVACLDGWQPFLKEQLARYHINKVAQIVTGGATGQDSIYRALRAAQDYADGEEALVMVHDAVRPFVSAHSIDANIDTALRCGCCINCVQAVETPLLIREDGTVSLPDRSHAAVARAPQTFGLGDLLCAHERARADGRHDFTDSCSLMAHYGYAMTTLTDDGEENMKITTDYDLLLAEAMMGIRKERGKAK